MIVSFFVLAVISLVYAIKAARDARFERHEMLIAFALASLLGAFVLIQSAKITDLEESIKHMESK